VADEAGFGLAALLKNLKRSAYETDNEIQDLLADGHDDSNSDACHPGGGADTNILQRYLRRG
jgi:hypothetical protein